MRPLKVAAIATLGYLLLVPLTVTVLTSLRGPVRKLPFEPGSYFTFDNFIRLYQSGALTQTLTDTSLYVLGSVCVAFVISFAISWVLERTDFPARNWVFAGVLTPLMLPNIVLSQAWVLLISPGAGFLNLVLRAFLPFFERGPLNGFSMAGMILVQGILFVPFFTFLISSVLRNMDGTLEDASRASGAGLWQTLLRVTLPVLAPGLLSVSVLGAIIIMGVFEVPLLFGVGSGVNVISLRLWQLLNPPSDLPRYGELAGFGVVLLIVVYVLFFLYGRLIRDTARFSTVTGKGFRPSRFRLGWWKYPIAAALMLYFLVTVLFPLFILFWSSLFEFYVPPSLDALKRASFSAYPAVLTDARFYGALMRTLFVSAAAATIAVTVGVVIATVTVRGKSTPWVRGLDLFATSSTAIPAAVAGYAFLLFYLTIAKVIPIFGTVWVLVLSYSYRVSVAYRISQAGLIQISKELEEAGSASGASPLRVLRGIVIPLLTPQIFSAWALLFLIGTHEFTIAMFLSTNANMTLAVFLFQKIGVHADHAGAISVLFAAGIMALVLLLRFVVWKRIRPL